MANHNVDDRLEDPDAMLPVRSGRKTHILEISAFLFLIVPSMLFSFFLVRQGSVGFVLTAVSVILRDAGLVFLVLYFLWRNGEAISLIGWKKVRPVKEIVLGVILFFPMYFAASILEQVLNAAGFSSPATPLPELQIHLSYFYIALALIMVIVVAISEETIFRGYLMLRLGQTTGSTVAAIILSSFIFSLGHGYEGSAGVITVGFIGLVFAVIFWWRKNLLAPMTMHFMQDFIGIILIRLQTG